ncbi:MAG: hypothetical protein M3P26_04135 [Gemmatimonadota bacterium]|nr:hypothetical protein [Gemmatimonadota bacterium]
MRRKRDTAMLLGLAGLAASMRIHGSSPSPWALVKFGTVGITVVFLAATCDRPNGSNDAIPKAASAETAESIKDMSTAGTARARLAQPDTLSQAAMMNQD